MISEVIDGVIGIVILEAGESIGADCPFCGGEDVLEEDSNCEFAAHVYCNHCKRSINVQMIADALDVAHMLDKHGRLDDRRYSSWVTRDKNYNGVEL